MIITLFFIFMIWSIAALYSKKDESLIAAYKKVLDKFIYWFNSSEQIEYNPYGDVILCENLKTELQRFDVRSTKSIRYIVDQYSSFPLPCVVLDFIPQNGEKDFSAIKNTLKSVFSQHMQLLGTPLVCCDVFIYPVMDSMYYVFVCYATTEHNAELFRQYYDFQLMAEQKKALKSVHPPVDEELEKELQEVSYNDRNKN